MKKALLLTVTLFLTGIAMAGSGTKKVQDAMVAPESAFDREALQKHVSDPLVPAMSPTIGTYTTLNGFFDWQSNGGAVQHIQVNPANGNIHVVYMISTDSTNFGASRRTAYAFSSNDGATWENFSNLRVPARSSGYPTLTLLKGANAGLPVIGNHSVIGGSGNQSTIFIDSPEGTGSFGEISPPPLISGANQPIWPNVAGASDGSVVMSGSPSPSPVSNWRTRTEDFVSWGPWQQFPDSQSIGGRYPTYANDNGRVGTLLNGGNLLGAWWHSSTNNGQTWSTSATQIYPSSPPGRDTRQGNCRIWVGLDFIWNGDVPMATLGEQTIGGTGTNNQGRILFWSQATGIVDVADSSNVPGYTYPLNRSQSNHLTMGWSVIGKTGNTLVIVFQAMMRDTSAKGFNYGDLFYSTSTNNGVTWSAPVNFTNTRFLDERYPSISRWNPPGYIYLTWQEDTSPGSAAVTDLADTTRNRQVFYKLPIVPTSVGSVEPVANSFKLSQNYPNPFNPATKIDYTVAQAGPVSIRVYNTLGQQVATLLNEHLSPGNYQVAFDGSNLTSGVYIYTMKAGAFTESRRMVLIK